MAQIGRISGALLEANLVRNGVDLAVRNDFQTTQLLYLDVENNRIGVNTDSPGRAVTISGTTRTTRLETGFTSFPNYSIDDSSITSLSGDILLNASSSVVFAALDNGTIAIDDNKISTTVSNSNIDIVPNGTAETNVKSNLRVDGDIFTPGNITLEGSITFGDNFQEDTVSFASDVNSDIIPNASDSPSLGTANKRWKDLYTRLVNGESITTSSIVVGGFNYTLRQGNIFFVDQNGSDENTGDHPQDPFRTLKRALEAADASIQGPVAIMVGPGNFEEELPLEVPNNVTVTGYDIRNTIIKPAAGFEFNDVFLLDGETIVQHLTVSEFYSDTEEHYAFRFRPNATVSKRSPYVQNVTVLTYGSNRTSTDPRGFDSGDAGGGAFVDGAQVDSSAVSASMLFQSVTFLTPNAKGLVMTNGVRVEWLTSFTYFADQAILGFNGTTGRISEDGSTVNFGAELRSIGSANVYGNQGAIADGDDCLFYLINHNFAYVGTGKRADNDTTLAIEQNEITELNNGAIVFTSVDQNGKYKVGDNFFVDFETGTTTVDATNINADSFTQLNFVDGDSETLVNSERIRTGLIRFLGNNLTSLNNEINLRPENELSVNSDTSISQNLSVTGTFGFAGSLNLIGNQSTDTVKLNVDIDQDFIPDQDSEFDLGSTTKEWNKVYLSEATVDSISINDNYIETTESNADLELRANQTGRVISRNSVRVDNDLTVIGASSFQATSFQNITITKPLINDGNFILSGTATVSENLSIGSYADFENIAIRGNAVFTTQTNSDLELRANSLGKIISQIPVNLNQDFFSNRTNSFSNIDINTSVESPRLNFSNISIDTNFIKTENVDLEFSANGTGLVTLQDIQFKNDTLSTRNLDTIFSPNKNIKIESIGSIQIPIGSTGYTGTTGEIRFNEDESLFEAFNSSIITFGGVFSDDRETSVTIDAANPVIEFRADSQEVASIDSSKLLSYNINIDDININNNVFKTTAVDTDLSFVTNGTGRFVIDETEIKNNSITNTSADSLTFANTNLGRVKFNTAIGVVIPYGDTASQATNPPEGDVRYNTETTVMEVFNGEEYVAAAGTSQTISQDEYNELVELYTLILG